MELRADEVSIAFNLGHACEALGRWDRAQNIYNSIVGPFPECAPALASFPSNITRECPPSLLILQGNALLPF